MAWSLVSSYTVDKMLVLVTYVVLCDVNLMTSKTLAQGSFHKASDYINDVDIGRLLANVLQRQYNSTSGFNRDENQMATMTGLFPSEVAVNYHGEPDIAKLREDNVLQDLTSLPTLLTLTALIEAMGTNELKILPLANFELAVGAMTGFQSPLLEATHSALLTWWPRSETSGSADERRTTSENLALGGQRFFPFDALDKAVKACNDKCPGGTAARDEVKNNKYCLQLFNESLSRLPDRHNFPPDVTSSFSNLAIGALLQRAGDRYTSVLDVWKANNANFTSLLDDALAFTYEPFSPNSSASVIDSRSYYVVEDFLSQKSEKQEQNISLFTNWVPTSQEEDGRLVYGDNPPPIFNTIDLFGTATILNAVITASLSNLTHWEPSVLQTMTGSNLELINWAIANDKADYRNLLMTSHPSVFQFYWMLSRTMFELENARIQQVENYSLFQSFYNVTNVTVRHYIRDHILSAIEDGGLDWMEGFPLAYVDDVIGTADVNKDGEREPSGSDRLFTTATAASSLIYAWTVYDTDGKLLFLPDTPNDVALAISRLLNYVAAYSLNAQTPLVNMVRTSVTKHCQSLPYWFPSNNVVNRTGEVYEGSEPNPDILFGMRGYVNSAEYKTMLTEPHFGFTLPETQPGLNGSSSLFYFWSCPAYTQAMSLLALAQMRNANGKVSSMQDLVDSFKANQESSK